MRATGLLLLLGLTGSLAYGETTKKIVNPFTGQFDFITKVDSNTLPSGSTQYIESNPATQQTGTSFDIDGEGSFDHSRYVVQSSSPSGKSAGSMWLAKDPTSTLPCIFFFYNGARYHMCGCPESGPANNSGECLGLLCGVTYP